MSATIRVGPLNIRNAVRKITTAQLRYFVRERRLDAERASWETSIRTDFYRQPAQKTKQGDTDLRAISVLEREMFAIIQDEFERSLVEWESEVCG